MHLSSAAALAGAAALLAVSPASAAVTLIGGEVNTDPALNILTQNTAGGFDSHFVDRPGHDALAPGKLDLFASTEAFENAPSGGGLDARASVEAHWNDAESGTIHASGAWSLPSANLDPSAPATELVASVSSGDGPGWSYTFAVDRNGVFNLGFSVSATGDTNGLGFWDVRVVDNGQALDPRNIFRLQADHGFDASGQISQQLRADHTYTIALDNDEDHFGVGPLAAGVQRRNRVLRLVDRRERRPGAIRLGAVEPRVRPGGRRPAPPGRRRLAEPGNVEHGLLLERVATCRR